MKSKRRNILIGVGIALLIVVSYFGYQHLVYVSTDNAQIDAHTVLLGAKVTGYIREVPIKEGQKVKKGDLLVALDDRDFQNAYEVAKGEMGSQFARRGDAEKNYRRLAGLLGKAAVSQQQYDSADAQNRELRSRFDAVSAQVAQAKLNLDNTRIVAPSDGYIARKSAEVGQLATPGMPLVGFVSSESRWVIANFKETEISGIKPGAKAYLEVDAIPGKMFEGVVDNILPSTGARFALLPPDNATGNFTKVVQRVPVRININTTSEADIESLRAGLSVMVKVKKI